MSSHNISKELFRAEEATDPGNAGTVTADRSPHVVPLVSAAAETRTVARPTRAGGILFLYFKTDGGDITLTFTGGLNEGGATTAIFTDAGQFLFLVAAFDGTNYFWRKVADHVTGDGTVGYVAGQGGAVTQITSRSTGVTLSKLTGAITTDTTSLAAEATADFIVTNTLVVATDVIALSIKSGSNGGQTAVSVIGVGAGSFTIRVTNHNAAAGAAETGAIIINFAVIKAVAA